MVIFVCWHAGPKKHLSWPSWRSSFLKKQTTFTMSHVCADTSHNFCIVQPTTTQLTQKLPVSSEIITVIIIITII